MQCNRAVIAVVLPCLWLAGCWAGPPEEWECTPSSDDKPCPGGKVCQVGEDGPVCRSVCKTSDDCDVSSEGCVDGACRPYAQSCETSSECLPEFHCSAKVCRRREPIGVPCGTQSDACQSGHCVDGVCCDGPCDATCMTCVAGAGIGDGDDGLCHPVDAGLDPADDCEGVPACDGTGACFAKAQGEPCDEHYECATSYCVDGYCCSSDCSGLCVACRADLTDDTNGVCSDIPGGKDPEEECAGTGTCTGSGYCTAGAANGMPCGMDDQCASNHCADGVCCATACDTVCEACVERLTGTVDGTCAPIPEPFDPDGDCLASGGFGCNGAGACNPEKTWSAAVRIEESSGGVSEPDVGMDAAGNAIAVWRQRTGAAGTPSVVKANRYTARDNKWGVADAIQTDQTYSSGYVVVAVNAAGNAVAAWSHTDESSTKVSAARYVVGHGWLAEEEIYSNDAGEAQYLNVAIDDIGNAFMTWRHRDTAGDDLLANRLQVGVGWTGVESLVTDVEYVWWSELAASASGEALVVWVERNGEQSDARAARCTPAGGWEAPVPLESDVALSTGGGIAVDMNAAGDAVVVWEKFDGTKLNLWARPYKAGVWGARRSIESAESGDVLHYDVAVAADGSAVAVWDRMPHGATIDLWSNRLEPGGQWGSPLLVQETHGGQIGDAAGDVAGNVVAVRLHAESGAEDNVMAYRLIAAGEWGAPVSIDASAERASYPALDVSPTGDAVVVWRQDDDIWSSVLR